MSEINWIFFFFLLRLIHDNFIQLSNTTEFGFRYGYSKLGKKKKKNTTENHLPETSVLNLTTRATFEGH